MRGYGYEPDPIWPDFPEENSTARTEKTDRNSRENAPHIVLGEIGTILVAALGAAFVLNLLLFAFGIG